MKTNKFLAALMFVATLGFMACDHQSAPTPPDPDDPSTGGNTEQPTTDPTDQPTGEVLTCAAAAALPEGTEVIVEGYVIKTFSVADSQNNDGTKEQSAFLADDASATSESFEAYYLTVTESVSKGDKVRATGKIKYFTNKSGEQIVEIVKPGTMTIIEKGKGGGTTYAGQGDGTIPENIIDVTIEEAIKIGTPVTSGRTEEFYRVSGTVKQVKTKVEDLGSKYQNCDFIITDGTNDITCFRTYYVGNTAFTSSSQAPQVGQTVTVVGQLAFYNKDKVVETMYGYIESIK